jgi:hypothetical protein
MPTILTLPPGTKVWPVARRGGRIWCEKPVKLNRTTLVQTTIDVPRIPSFSRFRDRPDKVAIFSDAVDRDGRMFVGFVFDRRDC